MPRLTLARNGNAQIRTVAVVATRADALRVAKNKLQLRKPARLFVLGGAEVVDDAQLVALPNDAVVVASNTDEDYVGVVVAASADAAADSSSAVVIVLARHSWLEDEAVAQLRRTAGLPGIRVAAGMPDLHPGKGFPVGAAFASQRLIYPVLIGNDIGCGMALYRTALHANERSPARLAQQLRGLEGRWRGDVAAWAVAHGLEPLPTDSATMGTIGGGNHFAELQAVERIVDEHVFRNELGLMPDNLYLLVHSGSRSLGAAVLDEVIAAHGTAGLPEDSDAAADYMRKHDNACRWALANRELIARRVLDCLTVDAAKVLDIWHNNVTLTEFPEGDKLWLHRKGAAPADRGPLVIPGSRGTLSYLLQPIGDQAPNAYSLAHGAGRKWNRTKALQKNREHFQSAEALLETALGSVVVCEDKTLLYEEAPDAYKEVDDIIRDLEEAGLVRIVAVLRPVVTYKMRAEE
eukprot:Unigene10078_Nuclearia_a/m.30759 Unigene10078_Nuclearia_a/g.30759  ORF Unigene10078_Nuclearia_a/g.30759 Unigene10078_Nuclearia_a/m.30759 type:complete len:464 (-) Unigene10078_Nuclearia_a:588-1979(-)